jgi:hypothetical protein
MNPISACITLLSANALSITRTVEHSFFPYPLTVLQIHDRQFWLQYSESESINSW